MVSDIHLQNFRSYKDETFEFTDRVNIIVGPNASGKTNLLEALLVLASGKSYRAKDKELIGFGADYCRIEEHLDDGLARIMQIKNETGLNRASKQFKIKDKTISRLTLTSRLPVVVFEPNHLRLLSGPPENRRQYLDDLIEQTAPGFSRVRRQYLRTLAQRNSLLKSFNKNPSQLFVWNLRLSELGEQLAVARHKLTIEINKQIEPTYQKISGQSEKIEIKYSLNVPLSNYATAMIHKLEANEANDRLRGFTSVGPHREDVNITVNGHQSTETASRGENRSIVLALKIIELQLLSELQTSTPLLLLDDVFSELDGARRQALTKHLEPYQTFITTTDADLVLHHFINKVNIVPITQGN